jgi:chromate transporter
MSQTISRGQQIKHAGVVYMSIPSKKIETIGSQNLTPRSAYRPNSKGELFFSFTLLSLQGFGGVLPIIQLELVDKKKWLTPEEFLEDWALAQILPGSNVVNFSLIVGRRYFGLVGAVTAITGMLAAPLFLGLTLAAFFVGFSEVPVVLGSLRGMGAVSSGLIIATGLKNLGTMRKNAMGDTVCWLLAILTFVSVGLLHVPLILIILGPGFFAYGWSYWKIYLLKKSVHK